MKKISYCKSKKLAINEHIELLDKKYSSGNKRFVNLFGNELPSKEIDNFYYINIFEEYIYEDKEFSILINASVLNNLIEEEIIEYKKPAYILIYKQNDKIIIKNQFTGQSKVIDNKYIIYENIKEDCYFNTEILNVNFLNNKTINHFSFFGCISNDSIYILKRKNFNAVFLFKEI